MCVCVKWENVVLVWRKKYKQWIMVEDQFVIFFIVHFLGDFLEVMRVIIFLVDIKYYLIFFSFFSYFVNKKYFVLFIRLRK